MVPRDEVSVDTKRTLEETKASSSDDQAKGSFGGFVEQPKVNGMHFLQPPPEVVHNQLSSDCEGYRAQAIADGIPFRKAGLFPPKDAFLTSLIEEPNTFPFEKHQAGLKSRYEALPKGGWSTGNEAAENGLDLRMFWKESEQVVVAAARLGDRASIANGYNLPGHGGATQTLLDEATAELAKMTFSAVCATTEISFALKKPVPLHTTVRIDCQMEKIEGMFCYVRGTMSMPGRYGRKGTLLATCEAKLVDVVKLLTAVKQC